MTSSHFAYFITAFCVIAGLFATLPIAIYLFTTWSTRREKLCGFLQGGAILLYYRQFPPSSDSVKELIKKPSLPTVADEAMKLFKKDFGRRYGRRHYVFPLLVLTSLTVISAWWGARTLQVWFNVSPDRTALSGIGASALAGAYLWVIADEIDRFRRRDFTVSDAYYYVFRILISIPFGWALTKFADPHVGVPLAFFLGAFPTTTLFTIARRIASQQLKLGDDANTGNLELESLQSIGKANAERFKDEGVSTIVELAYADPIDLTIRTNFGFSYVVDCVSQALTWIYFKDQTDLLCRLSLRGAQEVAAVMAWLDDPNLKANAEQTIIDAAALLKINEKSLLTTLNAISQDPYTQFLISIWC